MKRLGIFLLLAATGCATITPDVNNPYMWGAVAAGAADTATTYIAIDGGHGDEANPLLAICGDNDAPAIGVALCSVALKASMIVAISAIDNTYEPKGWWNRLMWLIPIGFWGGAAVWNAVLIW